MAVHSQFCMDIFKFCTDIIYNHCVQQFALVVRHGSLVKPVLYCRLCGCWWPNPVYIHYLIVV